MNNKSRIFVWTLFDFGNSSYAVIIVAFVFAVFFKEVVAYGKPVGDFYWSLGINISMLIAAVLNPVCGAIADYTSNKKKFLFFFTYLCIVSTSLMYFTAEGTIILALILFIFSNIGFQSGLTFYDSFIPELTEPENYNKVSGLGYGVGYLGSLISVALVFPFKNDPNLLFLICAVFFMIFSMPLFLFLKEKKDVNEKLNISYFRYGFKKVSDTLRHVNRYKNLRNFLISFFLYIDAVNTIIFFAGIYASSTLNFETMELAVFFLIVQITAMIGSFFFGFIGNKIGIKRSIYINLIVWTLITLAVFFTNDKTSFYVIGGFAGTFLGSCQSLSRTMMSMLTPVNFKTEFFGFYGLFEKTSTLLGPLTFGLVSWITGSQKYAVLSVGVFFILGMLVFKKVKERET